MHTSANETIILPNVDYMQFDIAVVKEITDKRESGEFFSEVSKVKLTPISLISLSFQDM